MGRWVHRFVASLYSFRTNICILIIHSVLCTYFDYLMEMKYICMYIYRYVCVFEKIRLPSGSYLYMCIHMYNHPRVCINVYLIYIYVIIISIFLMNQHDFFIPLLSFITFLHKFLSGVNYYVCSLQ